MDTLYNPSGWQQAQHVHNAGQPSSQSASPGSALHPIDLSDYAGLGDGPGQPQPPYYTNYASQPSIPNYYSSNAYGTAFTSTSQVDEQWVRESGESSVPLSTYSELSGANGTTSSSGMSSNGSIMIDPALTTLSQPETQTHHSFLPSTSHVYDGAQSQYQMTQPYEGYGYDAQPRNFQIATSSFQMHPQDGVSAISPKVLEAKGHSVDPSNHVDPHRALLPLTAAPSQQSREQFLKSLKPLLLSSSFTGAGAVSALITLLTNHSPQSDVDAEVRTKVLSSIRDGAGNHYFRAWAENKDARDLIRIWLKAAVKAGQTDLGTTTMPLLHLLDRLPLTVDNLKDSKIGKIITVLIKDAPAPAIKDLASNIERKWRALVSAETSVPVVVASLTNSSTEDAKRKRKLSAELSKPPPPPAKRQAVASSGPSSAKATTISAVKKDKDTPTAKADSSFFSAVKPKAKLPSFKKALTPVAPPAAVKQEPAFNPFQEALMGMKTRKGSPLNVPAAGVTPPPTNAPSNPSRGVRLAKNGKPVKSVRWKPDHQLEAIKLIDRAIYDDDMASNHLSHSLRDLDRSEGAALHMPHFEETIDWFEPILLEFWEGLTERGVSSTEKIVQEEREKTALGSLYITPSQIPESPAEPLAEILIPLDKVDVEVRIMKLGPNDEAWKDAPDQSHSVADLVGQLSDPAHGQLTAGAPAQPSGTGPSAMNNIMGMNLPPEQLQNILIQLGMGMPGLSTQAIPVPYPAQPLPIPSYSGVQMAAGLPQWSGQYDYQQQTGLGAENQNQWGGTERGGWGQRGRGRGRGGSGGQPESSGHRLSKTKPCNFFVAGRCKYGDSCDFSHDPAMFQ